jgi:hypothetical protein
MNKLARFPNAKQPTYQTTTSTVTYSEEGLFGGLLGFITGVANWPVAWVMTPIQKYAIEKLKKEINNVAAALAIVRNGDIDEAKKKGIEIPHTVEKMDVEEIIEYGVKGLFLSPFYGAIHVSKIEDLSKQHKQLMQKLEAELKKAQVNTDFSTKDDI